MSRSRILAAVDALESAMSAGRAHDTRNRLRDLRALVLLLAPPDVPVVCSECEVGGGRHAEGCALAPRNLR